MALPGLPQGFASVAYADTVCFEQYWTSASSDSREVALQWARVYIEKNYFVSGFDLDAAPDSVKTGNSLLAQEHLASSIFDRGPEVQLGLTNKMVDADGVKSQKQWDPKYTSRFVDPFPEITAILSLNGYCKLNKGSMVSVPILRR